MSKCQLNVIKGLSSTSQASQEVVVKNCNAHSFISSDARRKDVFYVSECLPKGGTSVLSKFDDTLYCDKSTVVNTRYVYNTALDKKCVQGLLARGKKATMMVKQFYTPIKVNTRVFTARPDPKSVKTRKNSHVMYPHEASSEIPVSGTGVFGHPSFQHIDKSVPIVTSRTSCDNNGQLISQSNTDNGIHTMVNVVQTG